MDLQHMLPSAAWPRHPAQPLLAQTKLHYRGIAAQAAVACGFSGEHRSHDPARPDNDFERTGDQRPRHPHSFMAGPSPRQTSLEPRYSTGFPPPVHPGTSTRQLRGGIHSMPELSPPIATSPMPAASWMKPMTSPAPHPARSGAAFQLPSRVAQPYASLPLVRRSAFSSPLLLLLPLVKSADRASHALNR